MHEDVHAGKQQAISARIFATSDVNATDTPCAVQSLVAGDVSIDEILRKFRNSLLSPHSLGLSSHELLGPAIFSETLITIHGNTRVSEDLQIHLHLSQKF